MNKTHKQIIKHVLYDCFGNGNLPDYDELTAEDIKVYSPPIFQDNPVVKIESKESVKQMDAAYTKALQIKKFRIEDMIGDDAKVWVRWKFQGIHIGDLFDISATGQCFLLQGHTIYGFNGQNQIGEVWQTWDVLGFLRQIGGGVPGILKKEPFYFDPDLKSQAALLTPKEKECLHYLLEGKTAKETADCMHISFRTVEYHLENIKNKLGVFSKREVYLFARQCEKKGII